MKKTLFIATLFFCSCTAPKRMASGTYTIKQIYGASVSFKEIDGKYFLMSDTLKVNDKITMNVIRLYH